MNVKLKIAIIEKYGSQVAAAKAFDVREDRLSRIVHNRVHVSDDEKRRICWRLQKPIRELFPKDQ